LCNIGFKEPCWNQGAAPVEGFAGEAFTVGSIRGFAAF
jgi:hypothetical protein